MKSQNASTSQGHGKGSTARPGAQGRERLTPLSFSDDITLTNQFLLRRTAFMASNRGLAYMGPGKVEVQSIDFPKLALGSRKCEHGVILKIVSTNICGSDQH